MDERMGPLLEELDGHRERYKAFCRSLSAEELERSVPASKWPVKGYIIHLATIDLTVGPWFQSLVDGTPPAPAATDAASGGTRFDVDAWNEAQVAKRLDSSLDDVQAEMDRTRAETHRIMRQFDTRVLDGTMDFPGDRNRAPAKVNFYQYLRAWVRHDPAHAGDMLRALPERQNDPAVREWLDQVRYDDLDPAIVPRPPK
jgi:hypothetical protein